MSGWKVVCLFRMQWILACLLISFYSTISADSDVWENLFNSALSSERAKETLKFYTQEAHRASSDRDHQLALETKKLFQSAGIDDVEISEYWPLLTFPLKRSLSLLEPTVYRASLTEELIEEDESTHNENVAPSFLAYSANGNVTAPVVYANFGSKKDFEDLKMQGIDVKGKIVLVRYGSSFRGLKVRAAELYGAAAVLIYSDPKEDGFIKGPVYPNGPYRPPSGVQRGSIHYPSVYPGDPLTPGYPATKNATRLPMEQVKCIPRIPALPISYKDAEPFLRALVGHGKSSIEMGTTWQGGLPLTYYTGPAGLANVYVNNSFELKPIWNVVAKIHGTEEPHRHIIVGNHRDAWVYGAIDPSSGTASLIELAYGLGFIYKLGWRPRRTIVLASWDAEEYGLLGSVEWVEDHSKELSEHGAVYINVDAAISGQNFRAMASPSLTQLLHRVTMRVQDPTTHQSIYEEWKNHPWNAPHNLLQNNSHQEPIVGALGFGSDYVGFLQRLGIASMDIRFIGPYGVYHSNYDSFHWMTKFGDPEFRYHVALASILGLLVLELSDSKVLPLEFTHYGLALQKYADTISDMMKDAELNCNLTSIYDSISFYQKEAQKMDEMITSRNQQPECLTSNLFVQPMHKSDECINLKQLNLNSLNDRIMYAERQFLDPKGIPQREWYKHIIYAPDNWAGYEAEMFPTLRDAIEMKNSTELQHRIDFISHMITKAAAFPQSIF